MTPSVLRHWLLAGLLIAAVATQAGATDVAPGLDLLETLPGATSTYWDFAFYPVPADFFGPGSDPFDGIIALTGNPLGTSPFCPADDLTSVDTIVERQGPAILPGPGSEDIVPIEIVELSLVGIEPITVTYNGGQDPELWDVRMTVSPVFPAAGEMLLRQDDPFGGTFDAYFNLAPLFTFTRRGGREDLELDLGAIAEFQHMLSFNEPWEYRAYSPDLCSQDICIGLGDFVIFTAPFASQTCQERCPPPADAGIVQQGSDLFRSLPDQTFHDFAPDPIPADFFGPGSDPFDGIISLVGVPLVTSPFCPADDLSTIDTIIERQADAILPGIPSEDTIPIQMVELSLQSTVPITVTYDGGQYPELWEVEVDLSPTLPSIGEMTIRKTHFDGGTFDSFLPVVPRYRFTRINDGDQRVLDKGEGGMTLDLRAFSIPWVDWTPPPESCTSNFCIGLGDVVVFQAPLGLHVCEPICLETTVVDVVGAGNDLYATDPASTAQDFSGAPIPADFFGPGSDPFDGIVAMMGVPLGTSPDCPNDDLSQVDTIIRRLDDAVFHAIPSQVTVPIEIVELSLTSVEPITVTYNGGLDPELWELRVGLSPTFPSVGEMTIELQDTEGGTFESMLHVCPVYTFQRISDGQQLEFDTCQEGVANDYSTFGIPWRHVEPLPGSCTSNFCAGLGDLFLFQAPFALHGVRAICPSGAGVVETLAKQRLRIDPAVPNPARSSCRIRYAIPTDLGEGRVTLRIFDAAGRRVATLVEGSERPGLHEVAWDGTDRTGARVAAGVYFCRLEAGTRWQTSRLVVLR